MERETVVTISRDKWDNVVPKKDKVPKKDAEEALHVERLRLFKDFDVHVSGALKKPLCGIDSWDSPHLRMRVDMEANHSCFGEYLLLNMRISF